MFYYIEFLSTVVKDFIRIRYVCNTVFPPELKKSLIKPVLLCVFFCVYLFLFWCLQHGLAKDKIHFLFCPYFSLLCFSEFVDIPTEDSGCPRKPWIHSCKLYLVIYVPPMITYHSENSRLNVKVPFSPLRVTSAIGYNLTMLYLLTYTTPLTEKANQTKKEVSIHWTTFCAVWLNELLV